MHEKVEISPEDSEQDDNQYILDLLNAWLDYIEIKKNKPIAEVAKECILKNSK